MQTSSFCLKEGDRHGGAFRNDGTAVLPEITRGIACEFSLRLSHADASSFTAAELAACSWELLVYRRAGLTENVLLRSSASRISGTDLIVTLATTNTVELAAYLDGYEKEQLACELCGSDSSTGADSCVFYFEMLIHNRIDTADAPQTPARYYTKSEVDTLLAAKLTAPSGGSTGQVLTRSATGTQWNTPPSAAVLSVNGETGAVALDAADVGAIPETGYPIVQMTGTAVSEAGKIYQKTVASGDAFTFFTPSNNSENTFRMYLIEPATAVSFTMPAGIAWELGTPDFSNPDRVYRMEFRWQSDSSGSCGWHGWLLNQELSQYAKLSADNTFSGNCFWGTNNTVTSNGLSLILGSGNTVNANGSGIIIGPSNSMSLYNNLIVGSGCRGGSCYSAAIANWANLKDARYSLAVGQYLDMDSGAWGSLVTGKFNLAASGARVTGGGTGTGASERKNIEVLDWNGNLTLAGDVTVTINGTAVTLSSLVARIEALENA